MTSWRASRDVVPELLWRDESASTNADLVTLATATDLAEFTTLLTDTQTAGRGRLGRSWVAPAGASLAISIYLRPRDSHGAPLGLERFSWIPLAAGVAMHDALAAVIPDLEAGLKWPNDVLVDGRKLCGILAELVPSGDAAVLGLGINTAMTTAQLPVPTATSLDVLGVAVDDDLLDALVAEYLRRLRALVESYALADGDAEVSGLAERAIEVCATLGRAVRVELPGNELLEGTAVGLDAAGRLRVAPADGAAVVAVAAGDVTHVRHPS
ncbi:MAG: biotin--[acetyl-CoA-carboxylase] ligase [Leifsonia sp.]|nr:biotin--[acetyl-CoA-carboxylase] ligase [Leifsonia sp.]|tara:strand:+ start:51840 stop:52646 length:807 start_codon:yes stop_codon:yes gene_type:complete